jgi:hypothetical protein
MAFSPHSGNEDGAHENLDRYLHIDQAPRAIKARECRGVEEDQRTMWHLCTSGVPGTTGFSGRPCSAEGG